MPIKARWQRFTRTNLEKLPTQEGAYELANAKKSVIYIGSSQNVRRRLITHLTSEDLPTARYFRCDIVYFGEWDTGTAKEARHAEKFRQGHSRKPKYTKRSPRRKSLF
jgi:predicted GIY-YIG superfamily endonuclease